MCEALPISRVFDEARFAGVREVSAFNEDRRALLAPQNARETGSAHAAIMMAVDLEHCAVNVQRQLEVLGVKGIIGKRRVDLVSKPAGQARRHSGWRQAIRFQTCFTLTRGGRIEMKAEEQVGLVLLSEGHTIRKSQVVVTRAREKHLGAVSIQKSLETPRKVERELLFVMVARYALGAGIFSTMARIEHNNWVWSQLKGCSARQQRVNRLNQIQ